MIPFESPAIVGVSSRSDTVGSAGDFSGTRRKRHGCRPNRTPVAGRRDRRQSTGPPQPFPSPRHARQAKSGAAPGCGLPLVQPPRRFLPPRRAQDTDETSGDSPSATPASASGLDAGLPFARRQRRRAESREEFFGPDGTGDAPVHLAGLRRKRKPAALFTSLSPVGGIHRADRRVLRSKMATVVRPKKLGASCSPCRSDGQRVCQPLPSRKIRDKREQRFRPWGEMRFVASERMETVP